ncbi:MAG TPA: P-loop NTPase [Acidimicrobiales bacterium]|nr:P-loop NTPase [Acidimicrobiales bacterium]
MTTADADFAAAAVAAVDDPDLGRSLGELGMVRRVEDRRRKVEVELALPVAGWPGAEELEGRVRRALAALGVGEDAVSVQMSVMTDEERRALHQVLARRAGGEPGLPAPPSRPHAAPGAAPGPLGHEEGRPNRFMEPGSRTRVVGISSGKGGVGKSSVTVNLAVALAAKGHETGLLDADVYGFSVPKMLGVARPPTAVDELLVPPVVHGVRCLSMDYFVPDDQPVIWRGPMLHKTLEQFLVNAYWGEPDFLLIDMPPGTGDVALSLGQYLPRTEILVVTTPQPAAQRVAQRSALAARRLKLPVRGVVENMSWFTGDDGTRYELFGSGGGQALAEQLEVPLLARIPLVPAVRVGADVGVPVRVSDPDSEAARAFDELADALVALGPARVYRRELTVR